MEGNAIAFMGAGLGLGFIVIGAGLGIGKLAAGAAEAIGRQPSAAAQITGAVNLPLFLLEGVADSGRGVRAADRPAEVAQDDAARPSAKPTRSSRRRRPRAVDKDLCNE